MAAALILLTWILWILAIIGVGLLSIRLLRWQLPLRTQFHAGLWLGLGLVLLLASGAQLFFGLGHSWGTALASIVFTTGLVCLTWRTWTSRKTIRLALLESGTWRRLPVFLLLVLLFIALVDMSYLATGEPMDADAGSYRIGSILYASGYRTIPGLANLHFRFGFNSSLWPFAALVDQGPWSSQGYRIVTGIFLTALVADLLIRLGIRRQGGSLPGDWFVVIATGFVGGVILTDSGRWVPSPAQDITVLVLSIASTAFLADFLARRTMSRTSLSMAIITAATAGSLRPLGWVLFVVTTAVIIIVLLKQGRSTGDLYRYLGWPLAFSGILALVMAVRDAIVSGWILYPLNLFPMPVVWRTPTTDVAREGITAYGRAPGVDMYEVLASNSWFDPWLQAFVTSREVFFFELMIAGALLPLLWPRGRRAWAQAWRPMVWALTPSLVAGIVWFVTAPDIRFGWGPLLALAALPGAFVLWAKGYPSRAATWIGAVLVAAFMTTQVLNGRYLPRGGAPQAVPIHFGPISVSVHLTPPPTPEAISGTLGDGTPILFPAVGGNCYDIFPMCLLRGSGGNVRSLGDDISDGFAVDAEAR